MGRGADTSGEGTDPTLLLGLDELSDRLQAVRFNHAMYRIVWFAVFFL
jgi:hypothetical protein